MALTTKKDDDQIARLIEHFKRVTSYLLFAYDEKKFLINELPLQSFNLRMAMEVINIDSTNLTSCEFNYDFRINDQRMEFADFFRFLVNFKLSTAFLQLYFGIFKQMIEQKFNMPLESLKIENFVNFLGEEIHSLFELSYRLDGIKVKMPKGPSGGEGGSEGGDFPVQQPKKWIPPPPIEYEKGPEGMEEPAPEKPQQQPEINPAEQETPVQEEEPPTGPAPKPEKKGKKGKEKSEETKKEKEGEESKEEEPEEEEEEEEPEEEEEEEEPEEEEEEPEPGGGGSKSKKKKGKETGKKGKEGKEEGKEGGKGGEEGKEGKEREKALSPEELESLVSKLEKQLEKASVEGEDMWKRLSNLPDEVLEKLLEAMQKRKETSPEKQKQLDEKRLQLEKQKLDKIGSKQELTKKIAELEADLAANPNKKDLIQEILNHAKRIQNEGIPHEMIKDLQGMLRDKKKLDQAAKACEYLSKHDLSKDDLNKIAQTLKATKIQDERLKKLAGDFQAKAKEKMDVKDANKYATDMLSMLAERIKKTEPTSAMLKDIQDMAELSLLAYDQQAIDQAKQIIKDKINQVDQDFDKNVQVLSDDPAANKLSEEATAIDNRSASGNYEQFMKQRDQVATRIGIIERLQILKGIEKAKKIVMEKVVTIPKTWEKLKKVLIDLGFSISDVQDEVESVEFTATKDTKEWHLVYEKKKAILTDERGKIINDLNKL